MFGYKVYTENKDMGIVVNALDRYGFDGATIYETIGIWKGDTEYSLVIEIFCAQNQDHAVRAFADHLKSELQQESVMVHFMGFCRIEF